MKLFYKIWVDIIEFEKSKTLNMGKWKGFSMVYMTILVSINIATILSLLFLLKIDLATPTMKFLIFLGIENEKIQNLLWAFITLFLPAFFFNYILIFSNKNFEKLIVKYQNVKIKKGSIVRKYFFVSFILFFGISLLNKLIN